MNVAVTQRAGGKRFRQSEQLDGPAVNDLYHSGRVQRHDALVDICQRPLKLLELSAHSLLALAQKEAFVVKPGIGFVPDPNEA